MTKTGRKSNGCLTTVMLTIGGICVLATLAVIQVIDFVSNELPENVSKFVAGDFTAGEVADGCRGVRWRELGEPENPRDWMFDPPRALTGSLKCAPVMMKAIAVAEKARRRPFESDGEAYCAPARMGPTEVVRHGVGSFLAFLERNPQRRGAHYRGVLRDAFRLAFPCGESA